MFDDVIKHTHIFLIAVDLCFNSLTIAANNSSYFNFRTNSCLLKDCLIEVKDFHLLITAIVIQVIRDSFKKNVCTGIELLKQKATIFYQSAKK